MVVATASRNDRWSEAARKRICFAVQPSAMGLRDANDMLAVVPYAERAARRDIALAWASDIAADRVASSKRSVILKGLPLRIALCECRRKLCSTWLVHKR